MVKAHLLLHSGAVHCTSEELQHFNPPEKTTTYEPIHHWDLANTVKEVIDAQKVGMDFHSWQFGLNEDGSRMFGVVRYKDPEVEDLCMAVGIRNSYDRSFSAALAMGAQVFVCDNMCFSGEVMMMQRHQDNPLVTIRRQLLGYMTEHNIEHWHRFINQRAVMMATTMDDFHGYRMIGEALGREIFGATIATACLSEWKKAQYSEFMPRNLWSLYNAGTFALKKLPVIKQFGAQKDWNNFIIGAGGQMNKDLLDA